MTINNDRALLDSVVRAYTRGSRIYVVTDDCLLFLINYEEVLEDDRDDCWYVS